MLTYTDEPVRRNWSTLMLAWATYFFAVCAAMALVSKAWLTAAILASWASAGFFATYGHGTLAKILRWVFWFGVAALVVTGMIALYLH